MRGCCAYLWCSGFVGFIQIETWDDGGVRVFGGGAALLGNILRTTYSKILLVKLKYMPDILHSSSVISA